MVVELQHPSRLFGLASLNGANRSPWSRPLRPGELASDAEVVTRVRPFADARDANRIPAGRPPEVDQERAERPNPEAMVALHQAPGQADIF